MELIIGIILVLIAGFMQGTFVLPMTLVKNWKWEHIWLVFSLLSMVVINVLLAFIFIHKLHLVYLDVDVKEILVLAVFGFGWGLGAVLFGIGMDKLGMSLGYPIIMGLTASMGGLLPMFVLHTSDILKSSGLTMIAGTVVVILGIIKCSRAAADKSALAGSGPAKINLTHGIIIAVLAGILSSLPNIGFSFGTAITEKAISMGTSKSMASNAVWALFFTVGAVPNLLYTAFLIRKNRNFRQFFTGFPAKNLTLGLLMAIMWIGSFYLYGISSVKLGSWGNIVGWPMFISISIIVGNLWGLWRGEWMGSSRQTRNKLNLGLLILIAGMIVIGLSNTF